MTQVDGYIARRFKMESVVGTILDPAADKILMTTLTVTLALKDLIPGAFTFQSLPASTSTSTPPVPVAAIILGRDVLLSLWAFYIRYTSLPAPVSSCFSCPRYLCNSVSLENVRTILGLLHSLCGSSTHAHK